MKHGCTMRRRQASLISWSVFCWEVSSYGCNFDMFHLLYLTMIADQLHLHGNSILWRQWPFPTRLWYLYTANIVQERFEEHDKEFKLLNQAFVATNKSDPWRPFLEIYKTWTICCYHLGARYTTASGKWMTIVDELFLLKVIWQRVSLGWDDPVAVNWECNLMRHTHKKTNASSQILS